MKLSNSFDNKDNPEIPDTDTEAEMKENLIQIFKNLSDGKLSKNEALEKIKDLKTMGSEGTLFGVPEWEPTPIEKSNVYDWSIVHIVTCELPVEMNYKFENMNPRPSVTHFNLTNNKSLEDCFCDLALLCFEIIQKILLNKTGEKCLLQIVIPNTIETMVFSGLSGLLKTAALENPFFKGQIIFIDSHKNETNLVNQIVEEQKYSKDDIVKYECEIRSAMNLKETALQLNNNEIVFKDNGVYLITGGTGGIGKLIIKEILDNCTKAIVVITGRSQSTEINSKLLDTIQKSKGRIEYYKLDVTDKNAVDQCIKYIKTKYHVLNGVLHCAGIISDNFFLKKSVEEFKEVLFTKIKGAYNLDRATAGLNLDFTAYFSSIASIFGNVGQCDYAAANGFLDFFANYHNVNLLPTKHHSPAYSINWPLWYDGGMSLSDEDQKIILKNTGLKPIDTIDALRAFYASISSNKAQIAVLHGIIDQIRNTCFEKIKMKSSLNNFDEKGSVEIEITSEKLFEQTQKLLCVQLSSILKLEPNQIDPQAPMEKYGIDSILAMNLTTQLEKTFGSLPKTLFFEYQTIGELTEYFVKSYKDLLLSTFSNDQTSDKSFPSNEIKAPSLLTSDKMKSVKRFLQPRNQVSFLSEAKSLNNDPIAIVGLSGRYPKSKNIQEYWNNLQQGIDCISEVPLSRWDWKAFFTEDKTKDGFHYSKWGGFIDGVDEFDPRFFGISPREAEGMDPQERLFLQHVWMAIEDAGFTRDSLETTTSDDLPRQVGVYVGVMWGEYQIFGAEATINGKRMGVASSYASISNRVSYFLNLHGPSMTLDTMCSSSLTAIHLACQDLKLGRTNLAIAGGVNVTIHPNKYLILSAGQFISTDGHCQSFGIGGDGYIPGEGVGVVILKRLSEAKRDGNHIYGVIKGSALNHGGKTNGYTVPNPKAQANVINRALTEASVNAHHISYIEAHGTGTKLGDPIEISALTQVFNKFTDETKFCSIGSAKSNIGHCESAAGIAGLTKVLLQMRYGQIVPSLHSRVLNPNIDFDKTPFIVNQTLKKWDHPVINGYQVPRIAGISSFGAGGSNAHIIIEEYDYTQDNGFSKLNDNNTSKVLIPLSARTFEQLKQKAKELLEFIRFSRNVEGRKSQEDKNDSLDILDLAYTLQIGREAMSERCVFTAASIEQIENCLQEFINGNENPKEKIYVGQVKRSEKNSNLTLSSEDVDNLIIRKDYDQLSKLWVTGQKIDWRKFYIEKQLRLISLPTYPFARERYWLSALPPKKDLSHAGNIKSLHPLLHVNKSSTSQFCFESTFNGSEHFIADIEFQGKKILTSAVCIEMIRASIAKLFPVSCNSKVLELHNISWGQPLVIDEPKQISLVLIPQQDQLITFEISYHGKNGVVILCQGTASFNSENNIQDYDKTFLENQLNGKSVDPRDLYRSFESKGLKYGNAFQGIKIIYLRDKLIVAHLNLPECLSSNNDEYFINPCLLDSAFQCSFPLLSTFVENILPPSTPDSIESIRIKDTFNRESYILIRFVKSDESDGSVYLDIDVLDNDGKVCLQLKNVKYLFTIETNKKDVGLSNLNRNVNSVNSGINEEKIADEILSVPINLSNSSLVKPQKISIESLEQISLKVENFTTNRAVVRLSDMSTKSDPANNFVPISNELFAINEHTDGILSIKLKGKDDVFSSKMTEELMIVLDSVKNRKDIKVIVLIAKGSFHGDRNHCNDAITKKLLQSVISFPIPIVAGFAGDTSGTGFLLGMLCDFMVISETGKYSFTNRKLGIFPSPNEDRLFRERFGNAASDDFLYISTNSTGMELKEKGWTCSILPSDRVEKHSFFLASTIAKKSAEAVLLLKQHLTRKLKSLVNKITEENCEPIKLKEIQEQKPVLPTGFKRIQCNIHNEKVIVVKLKSSNKDLAIDTIIAELNMLFTYVKQSACFSSIVIVSNLPEFLFTQKGNVTQKSVLQLCDCLIESPIPIITALQKSMKNTGWLLSLYCDAVVYLEEGTFSASIGTWNDLEIIKHALLLFSRRFGSSVSKELLLSGNEYTTLELKERCRTLISGKKENVETIAIEIAEQLSVIDYDILSTWKKENALDYKNALQSLPQWDAPVNDDQIDQLVKEKVNVPMNSKVVSVTAYPEGIVEIKMHDVEAKNMFSDDLVKGIIEAFSYIDKSDFHKVAILTGFDNYFASGGTKETLVAIQEGKTKFTDAKLFHLAMECKIPVIAAMQGHGIGAGWSMGMFADVVLFSNESRYISPYINYGFTPGAGATFIFPEKTGYDLSRETLLIGREFTGDQLKERGIPFIIVPRVRIFDTAFELASQITKIQRNKIFAFKRLTTVNLLEDVEKTYCLELEMHEKTFVGKPETLIQINKNFGQRSPENSEIISSKKIESPAFYKKGIVTGTHFSIMTIVKKLLAEELHLHEEEIDENTQFVDMGLDSITGVTWVRKINSRFGTEIEATKIYNHPNLELLSKFIFEELDKIGKISETVAPDAVQNIQGDLQFITNDLNSISASLKKLLAKELRITEQEIDENTQFVDLGLDSITGVTWIRKINEQFKTQIEATKVYAYPTLAKLSQFVFSETEKKSMQFDFASSKHVSSQPAAEPVVERTLSKGFILSTKKLYSIQINSSARDIIDNQVIKQTQPIAIIGMAGQFPKANTVEQFWENISQGKDCISEIPLQRWSIEKYYKPGNATAGKTNSKWMGVLEQCDLFDPFFFNISPSEAECMDPQQRLFLQECWHAIENAGYNPKSLSGSKCGVFVGCAAGDYLNNSKSHKLSAQGFTGAANSILAGRISYFLNLQGPSISIDTACSSSLVAISNACESLLAGSSDIALAGGVNVLSGPSMHIMASQTGMLSADGKCHTFDQKANGFVPGEGVGVVMLKRLNDAQRDGDPILCTIEGWGINQDGKTNGITAPNPDAQTLLEQDVYTKFHIDPSNIQLIEAHGTGTKLGDPIEVDALKQSFRKFTKKLDYCALGSVKSNIGHCLTAAGVVGVIKLALALQNKKLPPTINFENLNEHIQLKDSPFFINTKLQDWELNGSPRRFAAMSSFGFSGTNAHLVISEYQSPIKQKQSVTVIDQEKNIIIPLSARTEDQLKQKINDLLAFLNKNRQTIDLVELSYTLEIGREAMGERLGLLVSSVDQLIEKLSAFANGEKEIRNLYYGQVKRSKESMSIIARDNDIKTLITDNLISQKKLEKVLDLWVKGLDFDWNKLYGATKPSRLHLPGYPFAQERYWIDEEDSGTTAQTAKLHSILHPLLHVNISDFNCQSYRTIFTGEELFVKDYMLNGIKTLPSICCVEMAYAALWQAVPDQVNSNPVEFYNIVWEKPVSVKTETEVITSLSTDENGLIDFTIYNDNGNESIVYSKGLIGFLDNAESSQINLETIKTSMRKTIDSAEIYSILSKAGLCYGASYNVINNCHLGSDQMLSHVRLPEILDNRKENYKLHPSLIESIVQSCFIFNSQISQMSGHGLIPGKTGHLRISAPFTNELFVHVCHSFNHGSSTMPKFDIVVFDVNGNICLELDGFEFANNSSEFVEQFSTENACVPWDSMSYIYKWEINKRNLITVSENHKNVLIVCGDSSFNLEKEIRDYYLQKSSTATLIRISAETKKISHSEWYCGVNDSNGFATCLNGIPQIDTLYFLGFSEQIHGVTNLEAMINNQEYNEIQLLRLVKWLKQGKKLAEKIDTYLITLDLFSLNNKENNFWGAGITGLGYSLAQGNYQFSVRNIDLSTNDLLNSDTRNKLLDIIRGLPSSDRGDVTKIIDGKQYLKTFYRLHWGSPAISVFRENGVYLILGGAGTVGQIITRYLIQKYNATVLWMGRSDSNSPKIETAIRSYGEKLNYVKVDVTQLESMQDAVDLTKKKFGVIHGAIFAGMVFNFENSIDQTSEEEFRSIVDIKTRGSMVFYKVLQDEKLDFMCFFSSGQAYSFSGASKLSAYATGITSADSYVHSVQATSKYPVGIINWGFWRSSVKEIDRRGENVTTENLDALGDEEGFACFEKFIKELACGRINQVLCMRVSPNILPLMNCKENKHISLVDGVLQPEIVIENSLEIPMDKFAHLRTIQKRKEIENWFASVLYCQINQMIGQSNMATVNTVIDLQKQCGIIDKYIPWWHTCLKMLSDKEYFTYSDGQLTNWKAIDTKEVLKNWEHQREIYYQDEEYKALTILVNDCLEHIPDIVRGKTLATDIIFPNSSMEKVEGVYKSNTLGDTFNEVVANAVLTYLQMRLQNDSSAKIRVLEIGAGTGGTSAAIFKKIASFKNAIEIYHYTDLSKAFFFHAENNYLPENPYIKCQRLDIEQSIESQSFELGSYDLVIATNVLHATKNIHLTLQNAQNLLRRNGYIILNEMSDISLSTHLTFGLLDGWWMFEDPEFRIPNCPGLYPSGWKRVLEDVGFKQVYFPVEEQHILGQQIILAKSNGLILRDELAKAEPSEIKEKPQVVIKKEDAQKTIAVASVKKTPTVQNQDPGEMVKKIIRNSLAATLKISAENIDPEIAFSDYGVDSILGVTFVDQINSALSIQLNTAIIFEYSTLDRLIQHVTTTYKDKISELLEDKKDQIVPAQISEQKEEKPSTVITQSKVQKVNPTLKGLSGSRFGNTVSLRSGKPQPGTADIAVIGVSGMFPKALNVDQFWRNLVDGVDGVEELPSHYLDQKKYYSKVKQKGKTRCKWGGILAERDMFDPLFFKISPKEAEGMNPHQRLVMQEGWKALEDAGYNPRSLAGSQTGAFIGAEPAGYLGESFTGFSDAIVASRLSYILDFKGPAFVVNTGCSSSAVALHLAAESLRNREIDLALAGGVNACMDYKVQVRLDEIEMISPSGRCFTFDSAGDGTIISEGVGVVVLKRLDDAIAAGDSIYGVICGSGINQDGTSNGITAPNGSAQEELILKVYEKFNIDPSKINYVEAHGTGTKLGDPIESNALIRAFKKHTQKAGYCVIGSAKSHVGHAAAAAGVIGLIKVLMSLKHRKIPKLLNFKTLNPHIDFKGTPFFINKEQIDWQTSENTPRMAALNSFGHSGTNAHLIIREHVSEPSSPGLSSVTINSPVIIPLSAKTPEQLHQKVSDLLDFIKTETGNGKSLNLIDISYTLQVGREPMDERLGFIVDSINQLTGKLKAFLDSEPIIDNMYQGSVNRKSETINSLSVDDDMKEAIEKWAIRGKYSKIVEFWVKGLEIDWEKLYSQKPRRISLPAYPFSKERYWITSSSNEFTPDNDTMSESVEKSIEDIINQINDDTLDTNEAVQMLKRKVGTI